MSAERRSRRVLVDVLLGTVFFVATCETEMDSDDGDVDLGSDFEGMSSGEESSMDGVAAIQTVVTANWMEARRRGKPC